MALEGRKERTKAIRRSCVCLSPGGRNAGVAAAHRNKKTTQAQKGAVELVVLRPFVPRVTSALVLKALVLTALVLTALVLTALVLTALVLTPALSRRSTVRCP